MLILASGSPRRKELIRLISREVKIFPADIDESIPDAIDPEQAPEYLAVQKALAVAKRFPDDTVIGCDTSVLIGGQILGKPKDAADAKRMLRLLSGATHQVITGCAILQGERIVRFSESTAVTFYELTDDEIEAYVGTGEPADKAGAYGIQEYGALLVKGIEGDYLNVVGLPVARLARELKHLI